MTEIEQDTGHYELGLRLVIAQARGQVPSDLEESEPNPTWADWAESLLTAAERATVAESALVAERAKRVEAEKERDEILEKLEDFAKALRRPR